MNVTKYVVAFALLACFGMCAIDANSDQKDMSEFAVRMRHNTLIRQHFETIKVLVRINAWHKPHLHGEIEAECLEWQKLIPSIDESRLEEGDVQVIQKLCSWDLQEIKKALAKA